MKGHGYDGRPDTQLTGPGNNGALTRYAPGAPASGPQSKWLASSNTENDGIRRHVLDRGSPTSL
ncbi:hypothetical protein [Streptomyces sp. NPDC047939]|uniref:hypothetical protein n=1 Tax=Streptomyces sp. NPDC047939 TaxID=3155381 RepID=UPI00341838B5